MARLGPCAVASVGLRAVTRMLLALPLALPLNGQRASDAKSPDLVPDRVPDLVPVRVPDLVALALRVVNEAQCADHCTPRPRGEYARFGPCCSTLRRWPSSACWIGRFKASRSTSGRVPVAGCWRSECRPDLDTLPSSLIFVAGCSTTISSRWYRVMGPDGHVLLKRAGSPQEVEESSGSRNPVDFAVRVVRSHLAKPHGLSFTRQELDEAEVAVFRDRDARRLISVIPEGVSLAEQSFSLSPSGDELAVLSDRAIEIYTLETEGRGGF